jgi:hypothetical protein
MTGSTVRLGTGALGRAVLAAQPFQPGQPIVMLTGRVLTRAEVAGLGREGAYAMQIGTREYMEMSAPGRYVNHSCDPNAGIVQDRILIALRPIATGEEIRFDYSTTMSEDHWTMTCRCGEPFCRGVILDFHHLPPILQNRYLQFGIVQRFIVNEVRRRSPVRRVVRRRASPRQLSL